MARAATTGGGRTAGAKRPLGWYGTMAMVALLGVFLIAFSRHEELSKTTIAAKTPPRLNRDHWHAAFSVYLCDHFAPNVPLFESQDGMHTHGDGVIHLHPFTTKASGQNARLGVFVDAVSANGHAGTFKLSATELQYPGDKKDWKNGDSCQGKPGKVKMTVNGKPQNIDPTAYHVKDGDLIDVGFVPNDTPLPSNPDEVKNLKAINDVAPPTGTTTPGAKANDPIGSPTTVPGAPTTTPGAATSTPPATSAPAGTPPASTAPASTPPASSPPTSAP